MNPEPWILLAEDNDDDASLVMRVARRSFAGVRLERAKDGVEALDLLHGADSPPALMILDLKMPRLGGLEVLERVQDVPYAIVVFTSSDEARDRAAASALGCREYCAKPVDFHKFVETVKSLIDRHIRSSDL